MAVGRPAGVEAPAGRLSVRANFSWIALGQGVFTVCQWGMLAVLAKLDSVEAVGLFTLALAICAPVFKLANLGLRHAQATDVRGEHAFSSYLGLRAVTSATALLGIAATAWLWGLAPEATAVVLLVAGWKAVSSFSEIFYGLFQSCERMDHVSRSLLLRGPLSVAALAGGVLLSGSLGLGVAAQLLTGMAVLALHDLPIGRGLVRERESGAPPAARRGAAVLAHLGWQTLPLGIAAFLLTLQQSVPRYFVAEGLGLETLGYFAAMVYILVAVNRFVMALGHSASGRLARLHAGGDARRFRRLLLRMVGFGGVLGGGGLLVVALFGREILGLLYTPEYGEHAAVFTLVMGAALLRYVASLLQFGITAARRFRIQVVHYAAVAAVALAGSAWLIEPHGLFGAGLVTLLVAAADLAGVAALNVWSLARLGAPPDRAQGAA